MRKNILFPALIISLIIACTLFMSDGITYAISSLMALVIISTIRSNRPWIVKMTRWGKTNPHKTQVLITVLQIVLMVLGIIGGYNFKQLGYTFSDTTAFVFTTIMVTGFLSVHFLPKRNTIAIPAQVNKHRTIFIGIALSSFVLMVITGNRLADRYPNSFITYAVEEIDEAIFTEPNKAYNALNDVAIQPVATENKVQAFTNTSSSIAMYASYAAFETETVTPPQYLKKEIREKAKAEKKTKKLEKKKARLTHLLSKKRLALAAAITTGAVLLIILLVILTCAGICLVIGGVAALASGEFMGLLALLGGGLITWLSIKGIVNISKKDKEKKEIKQ